MDVTDLVHRLLNDETRNEAVRGLDNMLEKGLLFFFFFVLFALLSLTR